MFVGRGRTVFWKPTYELVSTSHENYSRILVVRLQCTLRVVQYIIEMIQQFVRKTFLELWKNQRYVYAFRWTRQISCYSTRVCENNWIFCCTSSDPYSTKNCTHPNSLNALTSATATALGCRIERRCARTEGALHAKTDKSRWALWFDEASRRSWEKSVCEFFATLYELLLSKKI